MFAIKIDSEILDELDNESNEELLELSEYISDIFERIAKDINNIGILKRHITKEQLYFLIFNSNLTESFVKEVMLLESLISRREEFEIRDTKKYCKPFVEIIEEFRENEIDSSTKELLYSNSQDMLEFLNDITAHSYNNALYDAFFNIMVMQLNKNYKELFDF